MTKGRGKPVGKKKPQWLVLRLLLGGELRPVGFRNESLCLGRAEECEIYVHDRGVSRKHAMIRRCREGANLFDLDSSNGTRLNGEKILKAAIEPGDVIRVGGTDIEVVSVAKASSSGKTLPEGGKIGSGLASSFSPSAPSGKDTALLSEKTPERNDGEYDGLIDDGPAVGALEPEIGPNSPAEVSVGAGEAEEEPLSDEMVAAPPEKAFLLEKTEKDLDEIVGGVGEDDVPDAIRLEEDSPDEPEPEESSEEGTSPGEEEASDQSEDVMPLISGAEEEETDPGADSDPPEEESSGTDAPVVKDEVDSGDEDEDENDDDEDLDDIDLCDEEVDDDEDLSDIDLRDEEDDDVRSESRGEETADSEDDRGGESEAGEGEVDVDLDDEDDPDPSEVADVELDGDEEDGEERG